MIPQTPLDFSSLGGTVYYTVSATWEHREHPACVTDSLSSASMFKAFFNLTYYSEGEKRLKHNKLYES